MKKLKNVFSRTFLLLCLSWVIFALSFDVFLIVLSFVNEKKSDEIVKQITWKIDGTFQK